MMSIKMEEVLIIMVGALFFLGFITFGMGLFLLGVRAFSKDMQTMTKQTTLLAQKGIAEDVSGLVGNASMLVSALQGLVRTTAGIGIFLTMMGAALMTASYFLLRQIEWPLYRSQCWISSLI
jgi:hypothetical protein